MKKTQYVCNVCEENQEAYIDADFMGVKLDNDCKLKIIDVSTADIHLCIDCIKEIAELRERIKG